MSNKFRAALEKVKPLRCPCAIPLSFTYDGKAYHGLPKDTFHTVIERRLVDSNMTAATATGRLGDLEIRVEYTEYRDFPAVEWVAAFTNRGENNSAALTDLMIDEVYAGEHPVLMHSNGDDVSYEAYQIFRDPLTEEGIEMVTKNGTPCCGVFPFMRLLFDGHGVNLAVGWPGGWKGEFRKADDGASVRIGQEVFDAYLKPGETIRTPRVLAMSFDGDEVDGRQQWRRFYMKHIIPKDNGEPLKPMFVMTNPGGGIEFTKATEQNQIEGIDFFRSKGFRPDIWWLDAGWYPCDLNWVLTGSWYPNPEHFPNGLGPVGKKCEENDIRFLLWFELERVTEGSKFDKEHPDWMLYLREENGNISWTRMIDLSNEDCMNWMIDYVDNLIKESHVSIYRQDFNLHPVSLFWRQHDEEGRAGTTENHYIQNLLTFWDTLMIRNPGLWIDNCSSGGRRNDYELMRRSVPLHYTDVGYGVHPEKQQHYRVMFEWIPYFRSMAYSWDRPDGTYNECASPFDPIVADKFATYTAFTPAIDQKIRVDSSEEEMQTALDMQKIWRPAAELMLSGDYYPLVESHKSAKEYYACQFDDTVAGKGFIQVIRNTQVEEDSVTIYPHVEDGALYEMTCLDPEASMTVTADALKAGFTVSIPKRSSIVWFYKKI